MKLTPNQCEVLAVLADGDRLAVTEVAGRSGRQYVPGVVRVLESLRGDGLVSPLDGQAARRWSITEAGRSALTRHFRVRSSVPNATSAAQPVRTPMPTS
jgi:DNA-binding MarR family transcriptional regulator